ncbi:MAG: fused MFS/spermidine synthase [Methyloligellaceae bacterium]
MQTALYVVTVGATAACGLVVEIVAGRMLAPYLGMSLYTWTAIIAVVLAGFSLCHWVGGRIAAWSGSEAERAVAWVLLLAALSAAASLVLLRVLSGPLLALGLRPVASIVLLTGTVFFMPSFFVGIPSPVLTKLAIDAAPGRAGPILGRMYAAGAFGSILGTLAAGYLFISWLGTSWTMLAVAATYAAFAAVFLVRTAGGALRAVLLPIAVAAAAAAGLAFVGWRVQAFVSPCTEESDYYCIRIVDISSDVGAEARLMVLDHLGHGMNLRHEPGTFLSSYVELTDVLVRAHGPAGAELNAFFVGGGAYTLPRAWARRKKARVTVAEVDPAVTRLARQRMWLAPSPRLRVVHDDARRVLRESGERYGVIVGDAFHDIAVPQHLVTREFFELVRTRLRPGGVYVMNVVDMLETPRLLLSVLRTLRTVFPVAEIWLDDEQAAAGGRATLVLLAATKPTSAGVLRSSAFDGRVWRRWSETRLSRLAQRHPPLVLSDDFAPVDRLLGE